MPQQPSWMKVQTAFSWSHSGVLGIAVLLHHQDVFQQMWDGLFLVSFFGLETLMEGLFAPSFSYSSVMNTDLNWGLQCFRCCSGFFLNESSTCLWSMFDFLCGSLESQSLQMAFWPFFRLVDRWSIPFFPISSWLSLAGVRQVLFKWFLDPYRSGSKRTWVWVVKLNSA